MNVEIVEINPSSGDAKRARMKMSYQALSRILRGDFFPIANCTAPTDLLITSIDSDKDAYYCWVEYHSSSLPEVDVSQPLPETQAWEYEPADVWRALLAYTEKIDAMIDGVRTVDTEPYIACKEVSRELHTIIDGGQKK